jgi:DNA-binding transcriptional ArsR family regulator
VTANGGVPSPEPAPPAAGSRKERILDALGDPAAREILLMLNDAPISAQEMLAANRIPQSTLYRKLHDLQEIGLVGVQRTAITPEGKRVDLYRSLLERLAVEMYGRTLRIEVKYRDLASERLQTMWKDYRREAAR